MDIVPSLWSAAAMKDTQDCFVRLLSALRIVIRREVTAESQENADARWAGKARTVTSVLLTLGVFMVHAIALGNVTVSLDGVEYYVIKN